jgi:NAD(P)H-dependent FMN reductase
VITLRSARYCTEMEFEHLQRVKPWASKLKGDREYFHDFDWNLPMFKERVVLESHMKALEAIKAAKEKVAAAQAVMHKTPEYKETMAALAELYAARTKYCMVYHDFSATRDE